MICCTMPHLAMLHCNILHNKLRYALHQRTTLLYAVLQHKTLSYTALWYAGVCTYYSVMHQSAAFHVNVPDVSANFTI